MKRVAVYCRCSTQDQNLDLQRDELQEFVKARGWVVYEVFEEKLSGTTDRRPELQRMLRDAKERKFDVLLTWKMDRLFRSLKHLVVTIQELQDLGIDYVALRDNIDLSTSAGRLMCHMLASFAEFESSLIRDRVLAGLNAAKKRGVKLGRPVEINSTVVLELRAKGMSIGQIANELNLSKGGVHKTLMKLTR